MAARSFKKLPTAADPGSHPSVMPSAFDKYRTLGPVGGGSGTVKYADTPVILQAETVLQRAQDQLDYRLSQGEMAMGEAMGSANGIKPAPVVVLLAYRPADSRQQLSCPQLTV